MTKVLIDCGNPSSAHTEGRRAKAMIEMAREKVAAFVNVEAQNIIFTSGGTEANCLAMSPFWRQQSGEKSEIAEVPTCFLSSIEHPSVLKGGQLDPDRLRFFRVLENGVIDHQALMRELKAYHAATRGAPFLVSVMLANNETGALQPISRIAELTHEYGGLLHCDGVQAAGKVEINMATLGADFLSLSAHKIGGPQGAGALVLRSEDISLQAPLFKGGGQERGRRAGTENVAAIVGFGVAAASAAKSVKDLSSLKSLRDALEEKVRKSAPETVFFSDKTARLVNTSCFAVDGQSSEILVIALDLEGIAVSAGSACSSGRIEPSHVLEAMGIAPSLSHAAIRVSLGEETVKKDIDIFHRKWLKIYKRFKMTEVAA